MAVLTLLATISVWVLLALALVLFTNAVITTRFGEVPPLPSGPRVSVLVPARNEERHIEECVSTLLALDYDDFEVLVLDDESTDATLQILRRLAQQDSRLRVLDGEALPAGWTGKNWACHQLFREADGQWLLFTDADTRHDPRTLKDAVALMTKMELDLLSAMTRMVTPTLGTALLVPFPAFATSCVQPRGLAYHTKLWILGAVNGQWTLYRRDAYERIGGHEHVRADAVEDLALGRRAQALGLDWRLEDATDRISVRMYDSFGEAWRGFAKNYHALAGPWPFSLLAWLAVLATTLAGPAALVAAVVLGRAVPPMAMASIALMAALWAGSRAFNKLSWAVVPLGWAVLACSSALGVYSVWRRLRGGATWKGRPLQ